MIVCQNKVILECDITTKKIILKINYNKRSKLPPDKVT